MKLKNYALYVAQVEYSLRMLSFERRWKIHNLITIGQSVKHLEAKDLRIRRFQFVHANSVAFVTPLGKN